MFGIWTSKVVWHSWQNNATFSSFTNAKTHSPAEQPYSCSKCVKKFPLPHDLKEHERTHGAEPFRCLQCDKRFSLFDELKQHKRSHVGEEPFNCTKCDKKFALGSDLKEHERTHTDEEPFSCLQCDKKFKHFGDMKQHWGNTCSIRLFISYFTCFILATSIKPGYRRNLVIRDKKAATNFSLITRFDCIMKHFKKLSLIQWSFWTKIPIISFKIANFVQKGKFDSTRHKVNFKTKNSP